jgi:hypothetical protein
VSNGTFTKQAGVVYGADASASLKNTATSGADYGYAVYVSSGSKKCNNTADAELDGAAGDWE